jgi:hypothetical protein
MFPTERGIVINLSFEEVIHGVSARAQSCNFNAISSIHSKIVQRRLGHASVAFTLGIHSHSVSGLQKATAKRLDKVPQVKLAKIVDAAKRR